MQEFRMILFYWVMACWIGFFLVFILRKRPRENKEQKRAPISRVGIIVTGCGFGVVWGIHRIYGTPIAVMPVPLELAVSILIALLAMGSVWLCLAAVRTLGKQWAIAARVIEGHELVTSGPYSLIRNPIYTGMLGMLLCTGFVAGQWFALPIGFLLGVIGVLIRVKVEEKLLRETFGAKFDDYASRVSAIIPGVY
jgi:protein-S-isoprenylcysteine O-methyltransferase Ste14